MALSKPKIKCVVTWVRLAGRLKRSKGTQPNRQIFKWRQTAPELILAKRLFRKALSDQSQPQPRVINTDKARLYDSAIAAVKAHGTLRRHCRHRPVQYSNNILEQDHRAIKRPVKAKQRFREFRAARRTIEGYEAMHMIRKGHARWISTNDFRQQNRFIDKLFDLAA